MLIVGVVSHVKVRDTSAKLFLKLCGLSQLIHIPVWQIMFRTVAIPIMGYRILNILSKTNMTFLYLIVFKSVCCWTLLLSFRVSVAMGRNGV